MEEIVPHDWTYFWFYIVLGFLFLFIAAIVAKVKIGSFPINPLIWHHWVLKNIKK